MIKSVTIYLEWNNTPFLYHFKCFWKQNINGPFHTIPLLDIYVENAEFATFMKKKYNRIIY